MIVAVPVLVTGRGARGAADEGSFLLTVRCVFLIG